MPKKHITFEWLGSQEYPAGLELQRSTWQKVHNQGAGIVLGLEHPAVITLGKRSDPSVDLKSPLKGLEERGIKVVPVDRGGEAVLHSPGQLVIYPVLNLRELELTVRDYVCALEKATVRFLGQLQVQAHSGREEPGIYTKRGKIAFVGIRVERGITRHGIAINVANDTDLFNHIRCCGKADETFDRLANYGVNATLAQLFNRWSASFRWSLGLTSQSASAYSEPQVQRSTQML